MDPRKERDQRLFLLAGMGRVGTKEDAKRVNAHIDELSQQKRVDPQWLAELRSLHAFLSLLAA